MFRKCALAACFLALVWWPAVLSAQAHSLWVLQKPNRAVEYDPNTFAVRQTLQVPPQIFNRPEDLSINSKGQMLFPLNLAEMSGESVAQKFWIWTGSTAQTLVRSATRKTSDDGQRLTVAVPHPLLCADGNHLLWYQNSFQRQLKDGLDRSQVTTFRVSLTDLSGDREQPVAEFGFPACECATGACEETCPEAQVWAPARGVDRFLLVTNWIPGQIQSTFQSTGLYQQTEQGWVHRQLSQPLEQILDAARSGEWILASEPDAGCCGWANESDDRTLLVRGAESLVVYDEFQHYDNRNYDVSFFTADARLSPSLTMAAYTIDATPLPEGSDIRRSLDGKPNSSELAHIQKALLDLPVVKVVTLTNPVKTVHKLPHSLLLGWVDDRRVLLLQPGRQNRDDVVVLDVADGALRPTGISVDRPGQRYSQDRLRGYVFVR
ncbi:MAG: hypothetical protein ACE14M_01595 [Terriglobales bacterium]